MLVKPHLFWCRVCEPDNMKSNMTNKKHTSPEEQAPETKVSCSSTPSFPMKAMKDALELEVVALPTSLQPHPNYLGPKLSLPAVNDMEKS